VRFEVFVCQFINSGLRIFAFILELNASFAFNRLHRLWEEKGEFDVFLVFRSETRDCSDSQILCVGLFSGESKSRHVVGNIDLEDLKEE